MGEALGSAKSGLPNVGECQVGVAGRVVAMSVVQSELAGLGWLQEQEPLLSGLGGLQGYSSAPT